MNNAPTKADSRSETIKLTVPTAFPDLNKKEGFDENHERTELVVSRLKFKHFRELSTLAPEKQMIFAISSLTGLSEADVDELDAQDAGEVTRVIVGFMNSFMDLAKNVMPQG